MYSKGLYHCMAPRYPITITMTISFAISITITIAITKYYYCYYYYYYYYYYCAVLCRAVLFCATHCCIITYLFDITGANQLLDATGTRCLVPTDHHAAFLLLLTLLFLQLAACCRYGGSHTQLIPHNFPIIVCIIFGGIR